MYDSHTYYRIDATEKWVCTEQKCYVSLAVNTVELTKPIQTDTMWNCNQKSKMSSKVNSLIQIESKLKTIYSEIGRAFV